MSIDISHIIRHDFHNIKDEKASVAFVRKTIERLKEKLCIKGLDAYFREEYEDGYYDFNLPVYDMGFTLHNGFWEIKSWNDYWRLLSYNGDDEFWLQQQTFDIAQALGQNEAWYATERYTWNGGVACEPENTFEEWYEGAVEQYGRKIPEFNPKEIIEEDIYVTEYEPVYHDDFSYCRPSFEQLQSMIPDYRLLGFLKVMGHYLRCEKDGELYLIDSHTQKIMFESPVDTVYPFANDSAYIVVKDVLSALFDNAGHPLTGFVSGVFDWDVASDRNHTVRIYNKEAGIDLEIQS